MTSTRHRGHSKHRAEGKPKLVKIHVHPTSKEPAMKMKWTRHANGSWSANGYEVKRQPSDSSKDVRSWRVVRDGRFWDILSSLPQAKQAIEVDFGRRCKRFEAREPSCPAPIVNACGHCQECEADRAAQYLRQHGLPESNLLPPERVALERARERARVADRAREMAADPCADREPARSIRMQRRPKVVR